MARHSLRKSSKSRKPVKPHPDYPLTPHASGQFCKKIRGRIHYFGSDPNVALRRYLAEKDEILAGNDPRQTGETLDWLCNAFLESRALKLEAGELSQRTFDDYRDACVRMLKFFGRTRRIDSLGPMDFGPLKAEYQTTWGPVRTNNEIGKVRVVLKYAYDVDAIERPIKTGPDFMKASKKTLRLHRKGKPKRCFDSGQINLLIESADVQMKAMILLGINAGYGNHDCGLMEKSWIDFDRGWLSEMRSKTAVDRDAWLWPETVEALRQAIAVRTDPVDDQLADRVFVTKYGNAWHRDSSRHNPISNQFTKLAKKVGVHTAGVSFYALRHTFETIAGDSRDQVAVDRVMGHVRDTMDDEYREDIDPQRIIDVCSHVRQWLYVAEVAK